MSPTSASSPTVSKAAPSGPNDYRFGYCTNVHAGTSLSAAQDNLLKYAAAVRQQVAPQGRLPVGLWMPEPAAMSLVEQNGVLEFRDWLHEHSFLPYTINGFPQGDFHQKVVKHAVYEPTWTCDTRTRYTLYLAEILEAILPNGGTGSISTLPLGWPHAPWSAETMKTAADNLLQVARFLERLSQQRGREVVLAIEAEPGCVLSTAEDMVEFFEHFLFSGPDRELARRHLTVCHDICHSGVMFESQADVLARYRQAGMRIGKVQVSSAVHVPWDQCVGDPQRQAALAAQLQALDEPKFLHQTVEQNGAGGRQWMRDDLPQALQRHLSAESLSAGSYPTRPWRVHFHVPIFVERFGQLQTTQSDIAEAVAYLQQHQSDPIAGTPWFTGHYEVETYAWTVLPSELAQDDLASGIARELQYFNAILV